MRIIQIGRGKYRRQLIGKPTARRLFGNDEPRMPRMGQIAEMNPKDFDGPGWECLKIAEANAGRYYHGGPFRKLSFHPLNYKLSFYKIIRINIGPSLY